MKATSFLRTTLHLNLPFCFLISFALTSLAQTTGSLPTNYVVPTVTIQATVPVASGAAHPGVFTVFRTGSTDLTLNVFYRISGAASNGVDYDLIGNWVSIPAGVQSSNIKINPTNTIPPDAVETVVLTLADSPLMIPINYSIGKPNEATVYITGSDVTNIPPLVRLVAPADGAVFTTPVNIPIAANAFDPDGFVTTVEFFADGTSLGIASNPPVVVPVGGASGSPLPPRTGFGLIWSNAPPGGHVLTAQATDNDGASTVSLPVNIFVRGPATQAVVSVRTSAPLAAEPCGTNAAVSGTFTVSRNLGTNIDLTVWYAIGGTASNGQDYVAISNSVVIPQGAFSADITITPLPDNGAVIETVVLHLLPPICPMIWPPPPSCYLVGQPAEAAVYIQQCPPPVTNIPPLVIIRATDPYAAEPCGTNAADPGKFTVARSSGTNADLTVFYAIGGTASNGADYVTIADSVVIPQGAWSADIVITPLADTPVAAFETVVLHLLPPVCIAISPPSPDCYLVGQPAEATVCIKDCLPKTNIPPVVRIINPANGAMFRAPVDIPIYAFASDPDGSVASVEFFAGSNSLGFGKGLNFILPGGTLSNRPPPIFLSNVFVLVWSNAPLGSYALTAKATDDGGASTVSDPVNITIGPPPPPPTNRPPIVSIVATEPVAIEGTNCWPLPWVTCWPSNAAGLPVPITFSNFCAPKNATFSVRRYGPTNDDLTVSYAIGGTATNGMDYVTLPGSVTIPAGKRQAAITIVSFDDGPPDITSTVILKLTPGTNYVLGFPRSAAAIIIDSANPWPPPLPRMLGGGTFHVCAPGPDGAWYRIEYSTDMVNWTPICTNQVVNGSIDFIDPDAANDQIRFYRTVPEAAPPQ